MSKLIYVVESALVIAAIAMIFYQTWSLNHPPNTDNAYYIKSVSGDSFSWFNYKFHALVLGLALIVLNKVLNKFTSLFSS